MSDRNSPPCILLLEGSNDLHVVAHISKREGLPHNFCIVETGNIDRLFDAIEVEADVPGRQVMGIVLDADENPADRWREVTERLNRLRQQEHFSLPELPEQPKSAGTIVDGTLRVGIWLMPDNKSTGELEDFVATMIPDSDPVWPMSQQYVDDIPSQHRKFKSQKAQKAKVHAWLATREYPRPMGHAIEAGDLNTSVSSATFFVDWLRELFQEEP